METGATIDLEGTDRTESETGLLAYVDNSRATGIETIVGCSRLGSEDGKRKEWVEHRYCDHPNTPNIVRTTPTTMTLIQIREEWFQDGDTRKQLVTALRDIMCHLDNINPGDLMVAHENIRTGGSDEETPQDDCIALWDRAYGGLELARILHRNLPLYARRLLEVTEDPERTQDGTLPLSLETARRFCKWVENTANAGEEPAAGPKGIAPIRTLYKDVTFRSKLEAKWAAWFDQNGISWEYEPIPMGNWLPDFRIKTQNEETYVEIKPADEFPADIAEKIDRSNWSGRAMILGRTPDAMWSREQGEWRREPAPTTSGESKTRESRLSTFTKWLRRPR